ncbi:MAG: hypothetical protein ACRCUM_01385 [Mycoplasmoidaceae bacterium]
MKNKEIDYEQLIMLRPEDFMKNHKEGKIRYSMINEKVYIIRLDIQEYKGTPLKVRVQEE